MSASLQQDHELTSHSENAQAFNLARSKWLYLSSISIVLIGLILQLTTYLNHDIAWVIYSSTRLVEGGIFGKDVIAANPPLVWYLSMPVAICAEVLPLSAPTLFRFMISLVAVTSALWSHSILKRSQFHIVAQSLLFSALFVFFCDAYRDFGQRDALSLILCLPYLCISACKSNGHKFPAMEAVLAGLLAGIGWAFKPYLLAVPILVELALFNKTNLKFHLRAEVLSAVLVIAFYVCFLFIFEQTYLFETIPMVKQIYWGFEQSRTALFQRSMLTLVITAMCGWLLLRGQQPTASIVKVLFAATLGFLISYLVQNKGYSYHQAPFRGALVITIAVWIASCPRIPAIESQSRLLKFALVCLFGFSLLRTANWYLANNSLGLGPAKQEAGRGAPVPQKQLIDVVNKHAQGGSFLAFSTHPFPGFPTALYTNAAWASRTNSRIFIPAIAKLRSQADPDEKQLAFAEEQEREFALHDLRNKPEVVLIDNSVSKHGIGRLPFDLLDFYLEDEQFRSLWKTYYEIDSIGQTRIFVRGETL